VKIRLGGIVLAAIIALAIAATSFAQVIPPTLLLTSSAANYGRVDGCDSIWFTFPTPNVSLAVYGGWATVQFNAPQGFAFYCTPGDLQASICYGTPTGYAQTTSDLYWSGPPPAFDFLLGNYDETAVRPVTVWNGETGFYYWTRFEFDEPCEFTSLTFTVCDSAAATMAAAQRQLPLSPFNASCSFMMEQRYSSMSLVPIPEPGFALAALAGLLILAKTSGWRERH
jgi:hypothetical protein